MRTISNRSGIEMIGRDDCYSLLADDCVGRVGVVVGATPMIFPVNYALDGDAIVMRTTHGSRLDVGQGHAAFEVDSFDREHRCGWSVLVTGQLEEVTWYQDADMKRIEALPVEPWAAGNRNVW